jgi:hypothetical protein
MQIQDHSQIQPALAHPDISNVTSPLLVWCISVEVTIQQVRGDVELMIAVRCGLMFARSNNRYTILTHQPAHAAMADAQAYVF